MTVARSMATKTGQTSYKEPSWAFIILLSGILSGILLFTIGWYLSLPQVERDAVFHKISKAGDFIPGMAGLNQSEVLLVMGVDMPPRGSREDYRGVRTDTMMLVRLDRPGHKINVVSVPRDCKVYIAGDHGVDKINAAFTYGGPDLAVETVKESLGVNVDHYLVINLRGVRDVVDALGGIDIYIEKPMHYRDNTAKLNINLEPGMHHLDGINAEGFLRFRHDAYGDIGRIRRQQQFMNAVAIKLKDPGILFKVKPLIDASSQYTLTDMSTAELAGVAMFAKDVKKSDIQVATLPGHPSLHSAVSYWLIDPQAAENVLNRLIVGLDTPTTDTAAEATTTPSVGVLYTPAQATKATAMKAQLVAHGFRVGCQAPIRRSATKLIAHNAGLGNDVEAKLQHSSPVLKDAQLIFSPRGTTFESNSCGPTDFTVVLGDDVITRSAQR